MTDKAAKQIRRTKHWWAWDFHKAEDWLEEMEAQGWRMTEVNTSGSRFTFVEDHPRKARFCVDFQPRITEEYIARVEADGWEPFVINANWCVCRKPYEDERPELSGDFEPLIRRNDRFLHLTLAGFAVVVIAGPAINGMFTILDIDPGFWIGPLRFAYLTATAGFLMGVVNFLANGRMLRIKAERQPR
jgi:hypothetical protein